MKRVPITSGLFTLDESGSQGRLIGGYCETCRCHHFPRSSICPYCGGEDCSERFLSERGRLFLYTTVRNRPPGYKGPVPFGFGVVELPEGIRIITRLREVDADRLQRGAPMHLVFEPLHEDEEGREVVSYAFVAV